MANAFEWCYFHFISEEVRASLILHQTDVFGMEHTPYMSISLSVNQQPPTYDRANLAVGPSFADQTLLLPNVAVESGSKIYIDAIFDSCRLRGHIRRSCSPIEIEQGVLFSDGAGKDSYWKVHVPAGMFDGTISIAGVTTVIQAIAYCDHQFGALPAQDFVREWIWGVMSNGTVAYGFFKVVTTTNETIDRAFFSDLDGARTFTRVHENYQSGLTQHANPSAASANAIVKFGSYQMDFLINPDLLVRKRLGESHGAFSFDYCRWHCNNRYGLLGFTEYMRFAR